MTRTGRVSATPPRAPVTPGRAAAGAAGSEDERCQRRRGARAGPVRRRGEGEEHWCRVLHLGSGRGACRRGGGTLGVGGGARDARRPARGALRCAGQVRRSAGVAPGAGGRTLGPGGQGRRVAVHHLHVLLGVGDRRGRQVRHGVRPARGVRPRVVRAQVGRLLAGDAAGLQVARKRPGVLMAHGARGGRLRKVT